MACKYCKENNLYPKCNCNIFKINGICNTNLVYFSDITSLNFRKDYNWTEISIPILIDIEDNAGIKDIISVSASASVDYSRLIETPKYLQTITIGPFTKYKIDSDGFAIPLPNEEGTFLTGRKLVIGGTAKFKVVYETINDSSNTLKSFKYSFPFTTFIITYPKFLDNNLFVQDSTVDLTESFCIDVCVEDIYVKALNFKTLYSSILLFIRAIPLN